ncbi:hypothetical protein HK097_003197, partial [Rhizophlyctis rosea]
LNAKRQRNTEAARRSRARKMERLDFLEKEVVVVKKEREMWRRKCEDMEVEQREREEQRRAELEELRRRVEEVCGGTA